MNKKEYFNKMADNWEAQFTSQEMLFLNLAPKFGLKEGQRILDVGTGTGILIPFLLKEVGPSGHITAIDYAEKMISTCERKFGSNPNITFKVDDIEASSLPSSHFDAVVCFGLFPHLEHKDQALSQLNRVLRVAGKLIIAHALSSSEIQTRHESLSSIVASDVMPTKRQMKQRLKMAGFGKIQLEDKPALYLCISTELKKVTG